MEVAGCPLTLPGHQGGPGEGRGIRQPLLSLKVPALRVPSAQLCPSEWRTTPLQSVSRL